MRLCAVSHSGRAAFAGAMAVVTLTLFAHVANAEINPGAASIPAVSMTCNPGQVDINHASIPQLMTGLQIGYIDAFGVVVLRPHLRPADLVSVGIAPSKLASILSLGLACATPVSEPPSSLGACTRDDKVDLQSAPASELTARFGFSKLTAESIVAQRPYGNVAEINQNRVERLNVPSRVWLPHVCLTPAPVDTGTTGWRWAYPGVSTTVEHDGFALTTNPNTVASGTWVSVDEIASPEPVDAPTADFEIHGSWADGTKTVTVTMPSDDTEQPPPLVNSASLSYGTSTATTSAAAADDCPTFDTDLDPALLQRTGLASNQTGVYAGPTLSITSLGPKPCERAAEVTSTGVFQSTEVPHRWLSLPGLFQHGVTLVSKVFGLLQQDFFQVRVPAGTPSCDPPITDQSLVSTTGPGSQKGFKYCVEYSEHGARWKLANDTATTLHFEMQQQARATGMEGGDILTAFVFDTWNLMTGGPDDGSFVQLDLPPGATGHVLLPQGSTDDHVNVSPSLPLTVIAFVTGQVGNITTGDLSDLYSDLNSCGWSNSVQHPNVVSVLGCAKDYLTAVLPTRATGLQGRLKGLLAKLSDVQLAGTVFFTSFDTTTALVEHPNLILGYRAPPVSPPLGGNGSGGVGDDGTARDGTIPASFPPPFPFASSFGYREAATKSDGQEVRGSLGLLDGQTGIVSFTGPEFDSSTENASLASCLSRHYVLRDFASVLWGLAEAKASGEQCPGTPALIEGLSSSSTNWILRDTDGHAFFLNGASQLENIGNGGQYMACAQRYFVLDFVTDAEILKFGKTLQGLPPATCGSG